MDRLRLMFKWYASLHRLGVPKEVCVAMVKAEMVKMGFTFKG